jgi:hypothetical protein
MPAPTVIHSAVYALLNLVGSIGTIHLGRAPEGQALPYTIFQRIDGERWASLTGPSGLAQSRFQVDHYAVQPEDAVTGAERIRQKLDGYSGTIGGVRIGGVSKIIDLPDQDDTQAVTATGQIPFRASKDYLFTHEEV